MTALVQQIKSWVLALIKQTQKFAFVCITIMICLLLEKKSLSLKYDDKNV